MRNQIINLAPFYGATTTASAMRSAILASQDHYVIRQLAEDACRGLRSKDYRSEALACYYLILQRIRYMRDPKKRELLKKPWVLAEEIITYGRGIGDCLPMNTLLLSAGYRLRPLNEISPGDQIWGLDRWTTVKDIWYKGVLSTDLISLNNGSSFRATPNHKVYIAKCKHGYECYCPMDIREIIRINVSELEPNMVLLTPDRLSFGTQHMDSDRAWIEGVYIADGWSDRNSAFFISGQDGCPKEKQKLLVQEICTRLGIPTRWARKYISVKDKDWTLRMHQMGLRATDKHALTLDLDEGAAGGLLRGIMADSGKNTHGAGCTFTTTSHQLMLQTRLLHKMFGVTCSERFVPNHGGLGKHPIWRLGVRDVTCKKASKLLRVRDIEREITHEPVYNISTEDHYVYLPEADVTVSNCDDQSCLLGSMLLSIGHTTRIVTVAFNHAFHKGNRQYSHVFVQSQEPSGKTWITLDTVAGPKIDNMHKRIVAAKIYPIM